MMQESGMVRDEVLTVNGEETYEGAVKLACCS
jgi:hypothetical protein